MVNRANRTTTRTRTADDGWIQLWEVIYGRPWPFKDHGSLQWLAAYLDWQQDQ